MPLFLLLALFAFSTHFFTFFITSFSSHFHPFFPLFYPFLYPIDLVNSNFLLILLYFIYSSLIHCIFLFTLSFIYFLTGHLFLPLFFLLTSFLPSILSVSSAVLFSLPPCPLSFLLSIFSHTHPLTSPLLSYSSWPFALYRSLLPVFFFFFSFLIYFFPVPSPSAPSFIMQTAPY